MIIALWSLWLCQFLVDRVQYLVGQRVRDALGDLAKRLTYHPISLRTVHRLVVKIP